MANGAFLPSLIGRFGVRLTRFAERRGASIDTNGGFNGFGLAAPTVSGVTVTPQTALTLTAFWAGVNVIATDVAKLPFGMYENLPNGGQKLCKGDPRYRLLRIRPNPEMNAMRYWQSAMGHALAWGNHYSEIVRDGDGMPTALWPLHPGHVKPLRDKQTKALYYHDLNTNKKYLPENVLHIAGLSFDGLLGYCPATVGSQAIALGIGAERFGGSFFGNSAIPRGILKITKNLSEVAIKRLRESWQYLHGGDNSNGTAVLEEGIEWTATQISPEAAQMLVTRGFQVIEIARLLNLPPSKLQDYSQAHLASVEESNLDYATNTLPGWLEAIEAECNVKLLFEDEWDRYFCQHDMSALLRGNMAARADYYGKLKTSGVINADTIAAREGLPIPGPENGGNLYLVQSQNIPAQNAGKPQPKPPVSPRVPSVKPDAEAENEPPEPPIDEANS